MLGCHDFCGHYEWTFNYVRQHFGQTAVHQLWDLAIAGDSQQHYLEAGRRDGLRGLFNQWTDTGRAEHCDWSFTFDDRRNVLRWDMRKCPSKGFLLANDLNADEDYCDHCMGWDIPLLTSLGLEVAAHEHNHCGQCWGELSVKGKPYEPAKVASDIRLEPSWNHGYLDSWRHNARVPTDESTGVETDWCQAVQDAFADVRGAAIILSGSTYATRHPAAREPHAVLIGAPPRHLRELAGRYLAAPIPARPVLLYSYLPAAEPVDFVSLGLPRPLPILPLLIRHRLYTHRPHGPVPTTAGFIALVAAALNIPLDQTSLV